MVCNFQRREERRDSLYRVIKDLVENASFRPPKPLRQLAEISHFNLFVTTNFDLFLEQAIDTVRFGGVKRTATISYATNKIVADLGWAKGEPHQPTVFHLLGQMSGSPRSYVICDEDLLGFVHQLLQKDDKVRPVRLFDELRESYLLILGQNFSDWLARFFLYLAKWSQVSQDRNFLEILADTRTSHDANLVLFLQHFSKKTRVFQGGGAVEFVEELWQRWRERYPVPVASPENLHQYLPPPREMPAGAVFISYAKEDLAVVKRLKASLDAEGLPVWFDMEQLGAGDNVLPTIRKNIFACSCFVAAHLEDNRKAERELLLAGMEPGTRSGQAHQYEHAVLDPGPDR